MFGPADIEMVDFFFVYAFIVNYFYILHSSTCQLDRFFLKHFEAVSGANSIHYEICFLHQTDKIVQ